MHVLIDLRWMIPGFTGGIETMARSLVESLVSVEDENVYTLLIPLTARYDFVVNQRQNFHIQVSDGPASYVDALRWRITGYRFKGSDPSISGAWANHRLTQADIAICVSGVVHPDLSPLKKLLILTDLQHEALPELFTPGERADRKTQLQNSLCSTERIIAISEYTRQTLLERHPYPASHVHMAHLAADPIFENPIGLPEMVWEKYGLLAEASSKTSQKLEPRPYLFFPAHTWPHKNHSLVLKALSILKEKRRLDIPLVCSGTRKEAHPDILKLVAELDLQTQFYFLGYCPRSDLPALYRGARALVFPSLYEGFGMPVLEAMWSDCPVICSNLTSLPEIAGDAALYVDAHDPVSLANAIERLLSNPGMRTELIEKGRAQVRKFSWDTFTATVITALNEIANPEATPPGISTGGKPIYRISPRTTVPPDRILRSRNLIRKGQEYFRGYRYLSYTGQIGNLTHKIRNQLLPGLGCILLGAVIGPDVIFNLILFPTFRDRILRPIIKIFHL